MSTSGKLDRAALPAPEGLESDRPYVAPRDALELLLVHLFEELLRVERVGIHDSFFDLGGHSLLAVRLVGEIKKRTGRSLPVAALFQAPTVEQLARALRQESGPWAPLVPIQPHGSLRPFFCVHPVGGNVLAYAELARRLGPERPFYGLQARGLEGGQLPLEHIEQMAALYVEDIRTVQPAGPYLLGGWSMGGVVAFEMARQLQRAGEQVDVLALIDPSPASSADPAFEASARHVAADFARDLAHLAGLEFEAPETVLASGGPEALLKHLVEVGARVSAPLPDLPQLQALLRVFTAHLTALRQYAPRPYSGPVSVLRASEAPDADSRDRGWAPFAAGGLEVQVIPGDHYSLLRAPAVGELAERLAALLARADASAKSAGRSA